MSFFSLVGVGVDWLALFVEVLLELKQALSKLRKLVPFESVVLGGWASSGLLVCWVTGWLGGGLTIVRAWLILVHFFRTDLISVSADQKLWSMGYAHVT